MARFLDNDLLELQSFFDRAVEQFGDAALSVQIDDDMTAWRNWMESLPPADKPIGVSGTLDPKRHVLVPGNSFWLRLVDSKGNWVGAHCQRIFQTDDFLEEIRTHRLFDSQCPSFDWSPLSLSVLPNTPTITGRVGFGGGMWIHPSWRGKELSNTLARLSRNLNLRHNLLDWYVSFIEETPNRRLYGHQSAGLMNSTPLLSGLYPARDREMDVRMFYMSRKDMLTQIRAEQQLELA
jgi:hypothetical protein